MAYNLVGQEILERFWGCGMSTNRPVKGAPFGEAVKALLGTRSIKWLASECRESHNSMRNWLNRNRLPRDVFEKIVISLGEDLKEFEQMYPPEGWTQHARIGVLLESNHLRDAIEEYESKRTKIKGQLRGLSGVIPKLFDSMGERDLLVFTSVNVIPYEFDPVSWESLGVAIARGIRRGAFFVYLIPDANAARRWQEQWGVDVRIEAQRRACAEFRKRLIEKLSREGVKDAVKVVDGHLVLKQVSDCPFWLPSMTLGYHQTIVESAERMGRFSIRIPSDLMGIFLLPQHSSLERILRRFLSEVLIVAGKRRGEDVKKNSGWTDPSASTLDEIRRLAGVD